MKRKVVLDTETTGLEVTEGHRVIEIGCVELIDRRVTTHTFHRYLNPERDIDAGALSVHGIDRAALADKPLFADIAAEFLAYIDGAEVLIHNAAFDIGFLDAELARLDGKPVRVEDTCTVTDTLAMARELFPGQRINLNALCRRFDIDLSARTLHGALLDAQLLAEVYLAMTVGQGSLDLALDASPGAMVVKAEASIAVGALPIKRANAAELAAHAAWMDRLDHDCEGGSVWRRRSP